MKQSILITRLGFLFSYDPMKTLRAFTDAGFSYWRVMWNLRPILNIIDRYKQGEMSTAQFKQEICAYFPGTQLSDEQFLTCWNAGVCTNEELLKAFCTMTQRTDTQIYLMSDTNEAHVTYIQEQIEKMRQIHSEALPGLDMKNAYYSYQHSRQENAQSLQTVINTLQQEVSICIAVKQPQPLTWLQWLNPVQHYMWVQACAQYNRIQQIAQAQRCSLITWPDSSSAQNIEKMFTDISTALERNQAATNLGIDPLLQPSPVTFTNSSQAPTQPSNGTQLSLARFFRF